ncbi:response regulator [Streptomyces sp. NPDC048507]|uniref:response regulator n=1 Tax=Streptomyces sp. NPDC048507 TaxID=3365560 RepID=UPI003715DB5A
MIRVAVIDDEPLVSMGLKVILESVDDISVVVASQGPGAIHALGSHRVDVLLLDIRMPGTDGLSLLRQLADKPGGPVVAMLTGFGLDEYVKEALHGGAAGFLMKNSAPEQLIHAVRTLAAGGRVLAPEATTPVIEAFLSAKTDDEASLRLAELTTRERQVLALVSTGLNNRVIAERMRLAHGTVKDHVSSILAKLGGLNRVQAAVVADRAGLLHPGQDGS